ncbi:MAG: sigma-70 family RNA polymerase sigma factor [Lachnospiraceae bacterium]|nr:sigma-70 family RNA polymerase sigma factor [Lachnospiraceae bacterium]MCM1239024.1 sigma-70 family RNA polymerase sigma factor [Lachnospiraceae bacterium]
MKRIIPLTPAQQELVETNLSIVRWVITESIHVNETIYGFEYDDLYQEGCVWLCHAAATYNAGLARFPTYAKKVVRNGLLSYCRQMCAIQHRLSRLTIGEHGELICDGLPLAQPDDFESRISTLETLELLASREKDYRGVAKLGIEALELKIKGMSVSEIAQLYHVPPAHVGAWISRSVQKLQKDSSFLSGLP